MDLVNKPEYLTHNGSVMSTRSECMISVMLLAQFRSVKTVKATVCCNEPAAHRSAVESNDPVGNLNSTTS